MAKSLTSRAVRNWRSRSVVGGRVNANELNQPNNSDDEATFFQIQTEFKSFILPKHSHPFPVRTRGAGGGGKARSDPLGREFPHLGEETTPHSEGQPESEWSISSIPIGDTVERPSAPRLCASSCFHNVKPRQFIRLTKLIYIKMDSPPIITLPDKWLKVTHEPSGAEWAKPLGGRWAGECLRAQSIK